jgi:nucleotide-binding universal stress UspA family protein
MAKLRHIVHATDFSRASGAAFSKAVEFAREHGARLTLAHVQAPVLPITAEGYIPPSTYERIEASVRLQAERQLGRLVARARRAGVRRVEGVLLTGTPDTEIVRVAKARRADLLVVGTHGRTGLARVFLGSVASRVIATASCPVLTVRGR